MFSCYVQLINSIMRRHTYIYIYLCIHIHLWCNTKPSLQEDHYKQSEQTAADIQQSAPSTQAKRANGRSSLRPLRRKKDGNGDVPAGSCQVAMFSCYVVSMVTLSEHVYWSADFCRKACNIYIYIHLHIYKNIMLYNTDIKDVLAARWDARLSTLCHKLYIEMRHWITDSIQKV